MSSSKIERKLAAIMFTDIAGYTAQMSKDEAVAISLLNKKESILKPLIAKHNGTYVKSTGDGSLSHFNSAVDAATCAKRFQESIYDDKDLNVRVGVHLGDTIFEKGDIRGDGVNIASRLESMAVEGGVFVSKEVHDQLANQKEFEGVSLGMQSLKGVGRLVEVYGLKGDKLNEPEPKNYKKNYCGCHSDDEVPSVVILPFKNKGKDEDEFYSYGIWLDLITEVSSAGLIRVASKQQIDEMGDVSTREIPNKLCVRYIVTGELWKLEDKFQLFIELYDTKDSKVVWTDKWQENWENLSTIKSYLSDGLLKALSTESIVEKQIETTNPEAYEFYLKAKHKYQKRENTDDTEIARGLLRKAIELDDNLLIAKSFLGYTYSAEGNFKKASKIYKDALIQSEKLNYKRDSAALMHSLGLFYSKFKEFDKALSYLNRSLAIRKELGLKNQIEWSKVGLGLIYWELGNYDNAIELMESAHSYFIKLGDTDEMDLNYNLGALYNSKGLYQKAFDNYEICLRIRKEKGNPDFISYPLSGLGWLYFQKKDYKNALKYLQEAYDICKEINLQGWGELLGISILLSLTKKQLEMPYDDIDFITILNQSELSIYHIDNYNLYQLLEDTSYLKTAYNQVQEKADNLEPDIKAKFLSYPIPKAIVEEWEKVK